MHENLCLVFKAIIVKIKNKKNGERRIISTNMPDRYIFTRIVDVDTTKKKKKKALQFIRRLS